MTEQGCILKNHSPSEWATAMQEKQWPIILSAEERSANNSDHSPSKLVFSQTEGSPAAWRPDKRRQALDRFSAKIINSGLVGTDIAVEYLRDKYSKNLTKVTITQAGAVVLSFLTFLNGVSTNIFELTRQDISDFVEREQNRGLQINSVLSHLRGLYTFLNFLVEREYLPQIILHKKIRLKLPKVLPRAIPVEDTEVLLAAIDNARDHALILLLLRTGMRIGELLNLKVSDIVLSERKILIYLGSKNYQGRVVYFNEDAERALRKWLRIRNKQKDYLFYSPSRENFSYAGARKVMVKILGRAGLSHKGYSLHSLRHTFATEMLNAGLRIEVLQHVLGHKTIDITMRYARMSDSTRESEYFRAMTIIEQGGIHESYRVNSQLQAVFEEKKLFTSHSKKLSS